MDCSTPGLCVPHHLPKFAQVHVHCLSDAIQPFHPLTPSSPSALSSPEVGSFPMSWLFTSDDQNTGVSAQASVLPMRIQGWLPLSLIWSCCARDSQEPSPAPQLEGINSLVFCLLDSPALTIIHDHWEDHCLDSMDLCQQSNVSTFQHTI